MPVSHEMKADRFEEVFNHALANSSFSNDLHFPWEVGFWKRFLDSDDQTDPFVMAQPPLFAEEISVEKPAKRSKLQHEQQSSWRDCVRVDVKQNWSEKRDADFQAALKRWLHALIDLPTSITVTGLLHERTSVDARLRMLRDLFWKKSPHTLKKRIHSLLRYLSFLQEHLVPFPGTEPMLYDFLQKERQTGDPTSRLQSVMQSLSFVEHVLGMGEVNVLTRSKRCMGASSDLSNGPLKQADPFLVDHVKLFHQVLGDVDADVWNRFFCGCLLAMIYSRSRWNDLQQAEDVSLDRYEDGHGAYLEFKIAVRKCRHSSVFRNTFLPAVAPGWGVVHDDWSSTWWALRESLGIDGKSGHPTMPAPDDLGRPTVRPLATDEMKSWVRLILQLHGVDAGDRQYTSHSCKPTALSWTAKYGISWEDRCVLGGHVAHLKSPIVYSRDALARRLYALQTVLVAIRNQEFFPDCTRSGRFAEPWRTDDTGKATFWKSDDASICMEGLHGNLDANEGGSDEGQPELFGPLTDALKTDEVGEPFNSPGSALNGETEEGIEHLDVEVEDSAPTTSSGSDDDAAALSSAHRICAPTESSRRFPPNSASQAEDSPFTGESKPKSVGVWTLDVRKARGTRVHQMGHTLLPHLLEKGETRRADLKHKQAKHGGQSAIRTQSVV
jgi:hypothetical protein